jgi:hypothetical protein
VRNSKTNVEMECFVFKSRIFLGTIAAASILAGTTAVPAMAVDKPHHDVKPIAITTPLKGATSSVKDGGLASTLAGGLASTLVGGLASAAPVTGALGGLANLPLVGPLLAAVSSAAPGGATSATDPVTSVLHGVTSAVSGLGSGTSGISGAVSSVTGTLKSVPLVGQVAGALPAAGSVTGALSGITSAIPAASAITSVLPAANG